VAILGSIVNGQLTVNLTQRLVDLGIPVAFRSEIITAVTTGTAASQAKAIGSHSSKYVQHIINEVVNAAYAALTHGLDIALAASGILLLVSALVAYFTGTAERLGMIEIEE
jgi:hypothetical protein